MNIQEREAIMEDWQLGAGMSNDELVAKYGENLISEFAAIARRLGI